MGNTINLSGQDFAVSDLDLRDRLAVERTVLANKRTFMSVVRTALTIAVLAFSLLKFFPGLINAIISFVLLLISLITLAIGAKQYLDTKVALLTLDTSTPQPQPLQKTITDITSFIVNKLSFVHLKLK